MVNLSPIDFKLGLPLNIKATGGVRVPKLLGVYLKDLIEL